MVDRMAKQYICIHIRWLIKRDRMEVLEIENQSFQFPWSEDDFIRCLRQKNSIGMTAEHQERVAGFMIYELHKNRLHILNLAVAPEFRRHGVGQQMIEKLIRKLRPNIRNSILLELRETNLGAQIFFRELGFRAVSLLHNFYADTTEDAYLMQYKLREKEDDKNILINRISRLIG